MDQGSSEQSPEEPDAGGRTEPEVSRRASESEHGLSKITHNALENMGALGHGLKHFFQPQRRRSSVSPHDSVSSCSGAPPSEPTDAGSEVGDAPASSALPLDSDNPAASAPPAALSRVLQQIRGAPPMMKRGTSLQSRRSKVGAPGDPPQKGSPQIHRRSTHEALLQAGRPRSSSTTDTPSSPALADVLLASGYHSAEDPDKVSALIPLGGPGEKMITASFEMLFKQRGHTVYKSEGVCPPLITVPKMNLEKSVANRHIGTIVPSKKRLMYFIGGKSVVYTVIVLNIQSNQTIVLKDNSLYTQRHCCP